MQSVFQLKANYWNSPLSLKNEEIHYMTRKHWISILPGLIISSVFYLLLQSGLIALLFSSNITLILIFSLMLSITAFYMTIFAHIIVEWYYSLYIITNRRLLAIVYTPLNSYSINDVLLDQVRCTEIDIKAYGIIHKLLDIGDISITFDRPTRQQQFILQKVKNFHKLSRYLCPLLLRNSNGAQPLFPFANQQKEQILIKDFYTALGNNKLLLPTET